MNDPFEAQILAFKIFCKLFENFAQEYFLYLAHTKIRSSLKSDEKLKNL